MKKNLNIKVITETINDEVNYSESEKLQMIEALKNFNKLSDSIYRGSDLKKIGTAVTEICKFINYDRLSEVDEWFDQVTLKRYMKQLQDLSAEFTKTSKDILLLQQRLEAGYEDISGIINRFYEFDGLADKKEIDLVSDKEMKEEIKKIRFINKK